MAATSIQAQIAIKLLNNKVHTDPSKGLLANEAIPYVGLVYKDSVINEEIAPLPADAVTAGVAQFVAAELNVDPTSNGHAYIATFAATISAGVGVLTLGKSYYATAASTSDSIAYSLGDVFEATSEDLDTGSVKEVVTNVIDPSFGSGYAAVPKIGATPIPPLDAKDWLFFYSAGVWYQDNNAGGTPTNIDLYQYIGTFGVGSGAGSITEITTLTALVTSGNEELAATYTVVNEPIDKSAILVDINGKGYKVGDAVKTEAFYFSGDSGTTPRSFDSAHANGKVQVGDELYYNGTIVGHDLDAQDTIDINQQINN